MWEKALEEENIDINIRPIWNGADFLTEEKFSIANSAHISSMLLP